MYIFDSATEKIYLQFWTESFGLAKDFQEHFRKEIFLYFV
jgi:hypothetical protein